LDARPDALFVGGDPFLLGQRDQIVSLAARHTLPAIYPQREYVAVALATNSRRSPNRFDPRSNAKNVTPVTIAARLVETGD
jgi:hypothetical protein